MRLFEIGFITLATLTILSTFALPMPETASYQQRWVLANDIYLEMYRVFGTQMFEINDPLIYANVSLYLNDLSKNLSLCIDYKVSSSEISTCSIHEGVYINRNVLMVPISLGVGK